MHPLVRKELREHLWVLIAMWLICALVVLALLVAARREGSPLVAYRHLVLYFGPLLSLALANRFVVREYGGSTQLFLETLPMGRAQVILFKWLTSAACLLMPVALGLALILSAAATTVELTSRFVLLLALRGLLFLLFVHALTFLVGLMGRYRYVLWMGLLAIVITADRYWQLPFQQWPPLQLVSNSMPFERAAIPVQALCTTAAATAALIAATFALALGFQGSWVVALARRMSLREKVVTTAAFIAVLYLMYLVEDRKAKPPFSLQSAVSSSNDLPRVLVALAEGVTNEDARALARRIAEEMREARDYLSLQVLPVVAVLPDVSIDSDLFLVAELPGSDGVVARGAFGSEQFDEAGFRAFTLARVLDWYSRGRASREERRWLLDGFSRWQVARNDPVQRDLLTLRAAVALKTVDSGQVPLGDALRRWFTTREQLGDCLGEALAWRATAMLAASMDEARFRGLARALFAARPHADFRAWLSEVNVDELLRRAGAPSVDTLAARLREAVQAESATMTERMQAVRSWPVRFEAVAMNGSAFELRYGPVFNTAGTPLPFAVRYARLRPWQGELLRESLERVDATASGVLPASFARGERVFTAMETHDPQLRCTVRLGARRWEVQ